MLSHLIDCDAAREAISLRADGALRDDASLDAHLELCPPCAAYERSLAEIAQDWRALREVVVPPTLWPKIEARAKATSPQHAGAPRPRAAAPIASRLAAGLVGFLALGGAAAWLEARERAEAGAHWVERLRPDVTSSRPESLFAALPEYRLLRGSPAAEDHR